MKAIRKPLALEDRPLVVDYLRRYPPEVSELTFTNLFVWGNSRPITMARIDETLVFLAPFPGDRRGGKVIFSSPLGGGGPEAIARSLESDIAGWVRIPEDVAGALEKSKFSIIEDRDNFDYVYRVSDLADLAGRRYHKKRNLIKQCLSMHTCRYEEITPALIGECLDMQDRWCAARDCGVNPGLCNEYHAVKEVLNHYEALGLLGGAVFVDGLVQAFTIGEALSHRTAVCHFEKAMPEIQGLSQAINQWFARHSLKAFEFVNREQDLGIPGLRQAKESYYPHHMVKKYQARLPGADTTAGFDFEPRECAKHMTDQDYLE